MGNTIRRASWDPLSPSNAWRTDLVKTRWRLSRMRRLGPDHLPIEDPGIRPVSPGHDAWAYLSLKFVIWHQRGSYAYALLRRADATKVRL